MKASRLPTQLASCDTFRAIATRLQEDVGDPATGKRLAVWLIPPLLVGGGLRCFHVAEQILVWDEVYTLRSVLGTPVAEILRMGRYGGPLIALFRLLIDHGVQLTEMGLRLAALSTGMVSLIAIPVALAPRIGQRAAVVLAWLLAVSPVLVLYSRIIHSYMPMLLVGFGAVIAFERWWRTHSSAAGVAYVILAALAVYLHLGAGPFVLAPFVYAVIDELLHRRGWRDVVRIGVLLGCVSLVIGFLLFQARDSVTSIVENRRDGQLPDLRTCLDLIRMYSGTRFALVAAFVTLLGARGAWLTFKSDRRFFLYLATLAVGQAVGMAILRPNLLETLLVVNRYLLVVLPFALAMVAVGLTAPWRAELVTSSRSAHGLGIAALFIALVASGPLATEDFRDSQMTHHPSFMNFSLPKDWISADTAPRFYRDLRTEAGAGDDILVEYPWVNRGTRAFYAYQRVHRHRILAAPEDKNFLDPRLALRHFVRPTPEAFLQTDARYVVVHLDLLSEVQRVRSPDARDPEGVIGPPQYWHWTAGLGANMANKLARQWGAPIFADDSIEVWDLEKARRR